MAGQFKIDWKIQLSYVPVCRWEECFSLFRNELDAVSGPKFPCSSVGQTILSRESPVVKSVECCCRCKWEITPILSLALANPIAATNCDAIPYSKSSTEKLVNVVDL